MSKFKRGDRVFALETIGRLVFGRKYIVHDVLSNGAVLSIVGDPILYSSDRFDLVKPEFDMKNQPWFIRVNNEEEFGVVADFLEAKGFRFYEKKYTKNTQAIGNTDLAGNIERDSKVSRLMTSEIEKVIHYGGKEIKLNFKTTIDSVEYPEVKSAQQVEIEQIETEMRKLADRLNSLKSQ